MVSCVEKTMLPIRVVQLSEFRGLARIVDIRGSQVIGVACRRRVIVNLAVTPGFGYYGVFVLWVVYLRESC